MNHHHRLTEKDIESRTAVCSVDGEVRIYRSGRSWVCATKQNTYTRRYLRRHPDKRGGSSNPHRLGWTDPGSRKAECAKCDGVVDVVPVGRGWMCQARAVEIGRLRSEPEPQAYCRDCADEGTVIPLVDGECVRCAKSLNLQLLELAATERELADADIDAMSFSIAGQWVDPYRMPDYESAVPGWTTLGDRSTPVATAV